MKLRNLVITVVSGVLVGVACGAPVVPPKEPEPVVVTSFSPEESMSDAEDGLRIVFNGPVVGEDELGVSLEEVPVELVPAAKLAAMWDDRQTLVVSIVGELEPSTEYRARLRGELARRAGEPEFGFVYMPLQVIRTFGVDYRWAPLKPAVGLEFNQEVASSSLEEGCFFEAVAAGWRVPAETPDTELEGVEMTVSPSRALELDTEYKLVCEGISGARGDVVMTEPHEVSFRTHPSFEVRSTSPVGEDIWSDEVPIEIEFSSPVNEEALREALVAKPQVKGIERGTLTNDGTFYRVIVDLKSNTPYRLSIAGDLEDVFGQQLPEKHVWEFETGKARPRLVMETGIYAVEAATEQGTYPVWTRNLSRYDLACASVPKDKVVDLLTGEMNYDPWYDAGDNEDLQWKKMGLKKRKRRMRVKESKDKWHLERLKFSGLCGGKGGTGLYLAEINSDQVELDEDRPWYFHPRRRVLANVTDMGVLVKAGSESGVVWVTSLSSGEPVGGADVSVYSPRGKKVFTGKTDEDGILKTPGADELLSQPGAGDKDELEDDWGYDEYDTWRSRRLIAVVEKDRDMAVVDGNWSNGIQIWNFGVRADYRSGQTRMRGFIISDRGIYRPGETVHFKGLIREVALGRSPSVPKNAMVGINVEDSRGQTVLRKKRRLSEFGGFAFDLALGEEASLGDYYVTATVGKQTFRETFIVEDFRKVSYELGLEADAKRTRLGKKHRLTLTADYLFGAPVADATVTWGVMRRPHTLSFPRFPSYVFSDSGDDWFYWDRYENNTFVSDGSGKTSGRGRFEFSFTDEDKTLDKPQDYIIDVTTEDKTGEVINKRKAITAHKSDVYVGLQAQEWVQAVGMPFSVNTVALTPEGEQVPLKATLRYVRERQVCKRSGGYRSHVTCETKSEDVWSRRVDIPAAGVGTERIMPKEPGEYVIRLEGEDARGNKVSASRWVWVLGRGEAFWSGDESARMSVVASKAEYSPGETAKLAPRSSIGAGSSLVTIERNGILEAFVKRSESSADGIEIPIKEAYAPNVFASVAKVKGRTGEGDKHRPRFQMGVVELAVTTEHQELSVDIELDKDAYEPGEKVTGAVVIKANGRPVRAEVAVSVADEGVLQLIGYKTPDPMKTFYEPFGLGVDSSTNLNRISRLNDPRVIDPDEGGDSGGEAGPDVRSRFVSSAFWASALVTDEGGRAAFTFEAPDNLTAFRVMGIAADAGSRFGSGERRMKVRKQLLARPLLPRFASAGDRLMAGVEVQNLSDESGTAVVTAKAVGCTLEAKKQKVKLKAGETARVRFPATVKSVKKAAFTFSVKMGDLSDAVRVKVPVNKPLVFEQRAVSRGRADAGTFEVPLRWGDEVIPEESRLEVTVDRSGLAELGPGLQYLIRYPYGCLEQTLSRLIPLMKVEDLAKSLDLEELRGPKLNRFIKLGMAKVLRHQHADGHFSLWPGGVTYPHLTVYAMFGLSEAKRAGLEVRESAVSSGLWAIGRWVNERGHKMEDKGEAGTLAMAAYVLAEHDKGDPGLNARLFEKRAGLPVYGKAFLLSAMKSEGARAEDLETLYKEIAGALVKRDGAYTVKEDGDMRSYMSSDARSTAIVLSALIRSMPDADEIDGLAEGLRRAQRSNGRWSNTQENLYALVALSDFARTMGKGELKVELYMDGERLESARVKGNRVFSFSRPLNKLEPGKLEIRTSDKGRHSVRLVLASEASSKEPVDNGFSVEREYVDPNTGKKLTRMAVGDLVRVRVKVKTDERRRYVAVEDPLPAGLEAVNTRLATSVSDPSDEPNSWGGYWYYGWSHTELRDDRVQGFADLMREGELTLDYLARAVTPGTFFAAPPTAEAMYEPEVSGRGAGETVEVER